ncbi:MAG: SEC-C metal-binding domain-containing protein, partial [Bacteroidales bacterium]|nr:SEC-C metal-binding domain-containing protein [Bacteroidales bacterium]
DDVMNSQRTVIYKKRRNALNGERLGADIANMIYDLCVSFVDELYGVVDFDELKLEAYKMLSIELDLSKQEYSNLSRNELTEYLYGKLRETHKRKSVAIANQAYPVIKTVFENNASQYENILVPVSDGSKVYNVVVNLEKTYESQGTEIVTAYNKTVVLKTIDELWKEHLREMDDLRQSVQAASYEQKDPLLIYKLESFDLFKTMLDKINKSVVITLMKGYIPVENAEQVKEARVKSKLDLSKMKTGREDPGYNDPSKGKSKPEPVRVEKKVGRNDPCPCGSGKKYKHCHGLNE